MTDYQRLHDQAVEAGYAAEEAAAPKTFAVVERANPLDDTSPVTNAYTNGGRGFEAEGSTMIRVNGNSGFGRWLRKQGTIRLEQRDHYGGTATPRLVPVRRSDYYGGMTFFAPVRGYERSIAFARAYTAVVAAVEPKARPTYVPFID